MPRNGKQPAAPGHKRWQKKKASPRYLYTCFWVDCSHVLLIGAAATVHFCRVSAYGRVFSEEHTWSSSKNSHSVGGKGVYVKTFSRYPKS